MDNKDIRISDDVFDQFLLLQKNIVLNLISDELKRGTKIKLGKKQYIIMVCKIERIIIYKQNDNQISSINSLNYDELFTESFLGKIINLKELLPLRLKRWANNEYKYLIKDEIINALKLQRLEVDTKENKTFIFTWKAYNIRLYLDENFKFRDISV